MTQNDFFSEIIDSGDFRVDERGHAILNDEFLLMVPPEVVVKQQEILAERMDQEGMEEVLEELGRFQVSQAIDRYVNEYGWDNLSRDKIFDYTSNLLQILGWGTVEVEEFEVEEEEVVVAVNYPTLPKVYRRMKGEAEEPVCHYLRGLLSEAFDSVSDIDIDLEEKRCAAQGNERCVFSTP